MKAVSHVRRWWQTLRRGAPPQTHYAVTCPCGQAATGIRKAHHQTVACPGCGRPRFVLPYSPLPPVYDDSRLLKASPGALTRPRSYLAKLYPWRLPLAAAALTLVIVVAVFAVVLGNAGRPQPLVASKPESITLRLRDGRLALSQGKFRTAVRELAAAQALRERNPAAVPLSERRELSQLHRQASLLADLLSEPLEDVIRHAADLSALDEQEWQAQFADRFKGRAVVFDDEVRRDAAGTYQLLGYRLFVRGKPARVEIGDLQLLRALPLDTPQRLLFGARLADVRLEAGGTWVAHLVPDSGVLLTERGAVSAICPLSADELRDILLRQEAWVGDLP